MLWSFFSFNGDSLSFLKLESWDSLIFAALMRSFNPSPEGGAGYPIIIKYCSV